jgi:LmbE family N-acetylglucosaminyl deacetylase
MKPIATTLAALCLGMGLLSQSLPAQTKRFEDPANLGDERVKPRDGRELPIDQGATGLQQMLRRLNTRASMMNIVAHPDDEDGGMLTFYSRGVGARVADLSLTRGEGGQNAMTGDFEDALGLLRTQELLACDRYSGIDQFFGTEVDFGFSKTKDETFSKWTHERVLYDVVRAIRIYRPLVLTTTWIGGVTDGHGQHQASGEIAQEAFVAAGDPKVFPELTAEGILPWQPLKIYARVPTQSITPQGLFDYATGQYTKARFENYVTGEATTTAPSTDVVVHEGETDSLLADEAGRPRSYVQFARMGLAQQKSQIGPGGRMPPAGKFDVSYHRYGSKLPKDKQNGEEESFFDGIDTSLAGIADLAPDAFQTDALGSVSRAVKAASEKLDPAHPDAVAPLLAEALQNLDAAIKDVDSWKGDAVKKASALHELRIKRVQLNDALALSLGTGVDAATERADVLKGSEPSVHVTVSEIPDVAPAFPITIRGSNNEVSGTAFLQLNSGYDLHTAAPLHVDVKLLPRSVSAVSQPYFFRDNIEQPVYKLRDASLRNAPVTPPAFSAWSHYNYRGVTFEVGRVVHAGPQSVNVVPALSIAVSSHAQALASGERTFSFGSQQTPADAAIKSVKVGGIPPSWKSLPVTTGANLTGHTDFLIEVPMGDRKPATVEVSATLQDGSTYNEGYRSIGYGDLPRTNYYTPATDRIVPVDLKLPAARKIGYLPGTGDAVPEALASIGLKPEMLTVADLTAEKLQGYDTVILGVRTYAAHSDLHGAPTQALLDYAKAGGNVVVQYQTAEFTGDDAPYPLTLGRDAEKVVDETDPVRLLEEPNDPAQRLLVVPNRIHPEDFNGWVAERGHGFLRTWDNHYSAPTETHDPGEDPQRGGLVTTQLGNGRWTYLAFAVYRQLPEAVPGAFRLFVNLLEK